MRWKFGLVAIVGAVLAIGVTPVSASASGSPQGPPAAPVTAPFQQCAAVYQDPSCGYLIDITGASASTVHVDPSISFYEGSDDVLVGVQNDSGAAISSIHVGVPGSGYGSFGFDGDGLCTPGGGPVPADCPFGPAGDPGDYFGPDATLAPDAASTDDGTVSFPTPLQPGQYTYFSLEAPFTGAAVVTGTQNDVISTSLTDSTNSSNTGVHLAAASPVPVTDVASIHGANGSSAGGSVTYTVYSDPACTVPVASGGTKAVSSGTASASDAFGASLPTNATYYVQASYTGDGGAPTHNDPTTTNCGDETVTFGTPPAKAQATIATTLVASTGQSSSQLTVATGTAVHDTTSVTFNGTPQSGRVTYYAYSDASCSTQVPGVNLGSGAAVNGAYPPSATVTLPNGTYYFQAIYSGNQLLAGARSTCAEVLSVKNATSVTAMISAAGKPIGQNATVQPSTVLSDTASVLSGGVLAPLASGSLSYALFNAAKDPTCSGAPSNTLINTSVSGGTASPFAAPNLPVLKPGKWLTVITYSGDSSYMPASLPCGGQVIVVRPYSVGGVRSTVTSGVIFNRLTVNGPGRITIAGNVRNAAALARVKAKACRAGTVRVGAKCVATSFGRVRVRVLRAGTYTFKLKPNAAARRALNRGRRLTVVETITFRPSDGSNPVTKSVRVTVTPPKHKKRR